jgi:ABC-2 type transport system permease protein
VSLASPRATAPPVAGRSGGRRSAVGPRRAWRWEMDKLRRQIRTRIVLLLCAAVPFAFVVLLHAQSATPQDTLFGRWVHESGFAIPLVILNFAGMWALPALAAVVAGDIFSSEDHYGTWKTVLTRSAGRGAVFAGKCLAAATWSVAVVLVLAVSSLLAGMVSGRQPLVGLSGQLVGPGRAWWLVLASWGIALLPVLGFAALGIVLSVLSRTSVVGMGGPVLAGLVMQLLALVDGPEPVRVVLLATPLVSWHGLWTAPGFTGPLWQGVAVSLGWIAVCTSVAWAAFRRRSIPVG